MFLATAVTILAAASSAVGSEPFYIENAFPGLSFSRMVDMRNAGDGSDRIFVAEQTGRIFVFDNDPAVSSTKTFLNLVDSVHFEGEAGLLSLAFHPDFTINRRIFVSYIADNPLRQVIASYLVDSTNPDSVDTSTYELVLQVSKQTTFHNAGQIAFDNDGYMLYSIGDDLTAMNAQLRYLLFGSILRIDVDATTDSTNYAIPPDNPYAGNGIGYRDEIYAWGFRNPWRISVDPQTGRIWCGDVGFANYEEVDIVLPGRNYAWPFLEAEHCLQLPNCDTTGFNFEPPIHSYPRGSGAAVIGGYVHSGPLAPGANGWYLFTDYLQGDVRGIYYDGVNPPVDSILVESNLIYTSTGIDEAGNVYFLASNGNVYVLKEYINTSATRAPVRDGRIVGNRPNPFNPSTTIDFDLERTARVRIAVFDVRGRHVADVTTGTFASGRHAVPWNGTDRNGTRVASGTYYCMLEVDGRRVDTRSIVLLK